ncbi:MAG: RNA 2',3'-cyclic phosphodiesterase [Burkholderiales bacterium]
MRLFFALWPTAAVARSIWEVGGAIQRETGGRLTRLDSIHITLAFLGEVSADRSDDAIGVGRRVEARAFTFTINWLRYWEHNRLVWVGPSAEPVSLLALVQPLQDCLKAARFDIETRPFKAHATLIRNARMASSEQVVGPIAWRVDEFALVHADSADGTSPYRILERFPLRD